MILMIDSWSLNIRYVGLPSVARAWHVILTSAGKPDTDMLWGFTTKLINGSENVAKMFNHYTSHHIHMVIILLLHNNLHFETDHFYMNHHVKEKDSS